MALVVHVGDAGREIGQLSHITANQRQIIDEPAVDDLARHRILGSDGLRLGVNLNTLGLARNLHSQVRGRVLTDVQFDLGADGLLKPSYLRCH